jgi:hypothetical protein
MLPIPGIMSNQSFSLKISPNIRRVADGNGITYNQDLLLRAVKAR